MTRNQMKKFAQEIYECEKIRSDKAVTKEDKLKAEKRIMQLTNLIMALPNGVNIMLEIDTIIQRKFETDKENL